MKSTFALNILIASLACISAASNARAQAGAFVESSRVGDATHFEFKGLPNWKYDLKREKSPGNQGDVIVLRAPKISADSIAKLKNHSDALIESVRVNEAGLDEQMEIAFRLRSKAVDSFDYISEQPSRLIVDFFPKEDKKKSDDADAAPAKQAANEKESGDDEPADEPAPKKSKLAAKSLPAKLPGKGAVASGKADAKRQPAASEFIPSPDSEGGTREAGGAASGSVRADRQYGVFDAADPTYKRFQVQDYEMREESVIAARANIYLRFPMLKLDRPQLRAMLAAPPIYEIVPQDTDENREARLVQTLYANKRPAVFLKTAKEFLKRYPESRYEEIIRYLIADQRMAFFQEDPARVEDFETALSMYQSLAERHPDSPLTPRTELMAGYLLLGRNDSMAALQTFQRFLRKNPASKAADSTKISIAEAFLNINRFDDAMATLDDVEKNAVAEKDRAEAAYRKGDVAFQKRDYETAIREYERAIKAFPTYEKLLANAGFNQAEAAFWLSRYKEAMTWHRDFLAKHPDHSYGGFALARLGELMEILGAGPKRAEGAWMESGFRYRGTPGADVSRVRLLTSRMPEMKEKEVKDALREIGQITSRATLPNFPEFISLLKADGFYGRGENQAAADELIRFYQKNPQAPDLGKLKERIARSLNAEIRESVEKGNFIEALRQNVEFGKTWLKDSDRIDTQVYVGRAYEQAGLFAEAASTYRAALNKLYAVKGTDREKERGVFETLPTADALNLRLAATSAAEKDYAHAFDYLKAIAKPKDLPDERRIERAQLAADVAEARGQNDLARKSLEELVSTWTGKPAAVAPIYLRLAKREAAEKEWKRASADVNKVLDLQADSGAVPEDAHAGALELKADVALAKGRKAEAVRAYRALLEAYEGKRPLGSIRYKLGQILFDSGEMKDAGTAWGGLKIGGPDDVWAKLAQEQMSGAKWQAEYSKYIRRIPAMAALKDGAKDAAKDSGGGSNADAREPASSGQP